MGLFSNKNKVCPVCGSPTPRVLPTKIQGMPICKQCSSMIDLPSGALDQMTVEGFQQYIAFYKENQALRSAFAPSYSFRFGFLAGSLPLDIPHKLFRLRDEDSALVFEASALKAFRITEDGAPLFEGSADALKCYQSDIPAVVNSLGPQLAQFQMQMRQYEQMERMMEKEKRDGGSRHYYEKPDIDLLKPFQQFHVELLLNHPYWVSFSNAANAPSFYSPYPSIQDYMEEYTQKVDELHQVATQLMQLLNPQAPEIQGGAEMYAAPQAAPAISAADEIRKFKELLDSGVISEEEFAAKKRQLLGL